MTNTIFDLLRILDEAGLGSPVAGNVISERLGVSRTTVWKYVNLLREMGYVIDASPKTGYVLKKRSRLLLPYEIKRYLETKEIGQDMHHFTQVMSTNTLARQMMSEVGCEVQSGTVLVAEHQTGGSGRMHRMWESPEGGIWGTIVLKPKIGVDQAFLIMVAASLALAKAIRNDFGLSALIHWPNDVFIGDKKVAGTRLELATQADDVRYCLLSIGVDVNIAVERTLPGMSDVVTSLSDELGYEVERAKFFAHFLKEFERRYNMILMDEADALLLEWRSLSHTLHRRVRIRTLRACFDGEAIGIDDDGALLVRTEEGDLERVITGECTLI
ncbi:MAG TPA: biotin--[acetyl-CoA-carboxylase] ligase [Methanocorpusculum sp.]|nr:biotin--[acetyl-CoA-carboxylase] ligase [Methanocorpusculum sp.]